MVTNAEDDTVDQILKLQEKRARSNRLDLIISVAFLVFGVAGLFSAHVSALDSVDYYKVALFVGAGVLGAYCARAKDARAEKRLVAALIGSK